MSDCQSHVNSFKIKMYLINKLRQTCIIPLYSSNKHTKFYRYVNLVLVFIFLQGDKSIADESYLQHRQTRNNFSARHKRQVIWGDGK